MDCYSCIYRRPIPGDTHSLCLNIYAWVELDPHGVKMGWSHWPENFDPTWVIQCKDHCTEDELNKLENNNQRKEENLCMIGSYK